MMTEPIRARFRLLFYEMATVLLFLGALLLVDGFLRCRSSVVATFCVLCIFQAFFMTFVLGLIVLLGTLDALYLKCYCGVSLARSCVFCLTCWLLLPPFEWVWFFSPVYLLLVTGYSWSVFLWTNRGDFNASRDFGHRRLSHIQLRLDIPPLGPASYQGTYESSRINDATLEISTKSLSEID